LNDVTQILDRARQGDSLAAGELLPLVYQELRRIAAHKMAAESLAQTLQPTALVHEAWLRLVDKNGQAQFQNRAHFFGAAAEAMRRIMIDRARRKQARKHGAGWERLDVDDVEIPAPAEDEELLAVNDALARFATVDAQKAELVKLRYFVGMTIEEAAPVLGVSEPTAKRWWAYARAWLLTELKKSRP
jgi:RNA polymerase sigma factor (TIGR02999 family)